MDLKIKNYPNYIKQFREKHVPKQYNQIKLLDELNNKNIDHFMSISNRTDGKSINYIHALLNIAIDYEIGLTFLTRNVMLRKSYKTLIEEIAEISDILELGKFTFITTQYYMNVHYNNKPIAVISDLNSATELKMFSNYLKKFPILIYDEFLALEHDYLPDEWEKLKTIYESIDRMEEYPLIHKPKIFYFGNAVNFDSPILEGMKLFNILEKHPLNKLMIYDKHIKIALEVNKNEHANKRKNRNVFGIDDDDAMISAQFQTNDFNIANEQNRYDVKQNPRMIYIKLNEHYLKVWFNPDTLTVILSVESTLDNDKYDYHTQLKDKTDDSIYLSEKYYDENHIKYYDRGNYLFENNYSKNYLTSENRNLNMIRINRIIREFLANDNKEKEIEFKEKQFKDNYIEQTKKGLLRKLNEMI